MDYQSIILELESIKKPCSISNWDGEDAQIITNNVIMAVKDFLKILPQNIPTPDIIPENDGEICLSWELSNGKNFAISIGSHEKINYAGRLNDGFIHGLIHKKDNKIIKFLKELV